MLLPSTSLYRFSENIRVEPVVVSELKLGNVQREILGTDLVIGADNATFQNAPETFDGVGMDRYKGTWNGYSFPSQYNDETLREFRKAMLKVMMLAVGAVLWADRRLGRNG